MWKINQCQIHKVVITSNITQNHFPDIHEVIFGHYVRRVYVKIWS